MEETTRSRIFDARAEVERAADTAKVVFLCNQFLGGWTPHRLAALPDSCQPPVELRDVQMVSTYAFNLAQAHCKEESVTAELHAMAAFFASAAARIAQLQRVAPEGRVPIFIRGIL
jgi:hypothetical protein